MGSPGPRQQMIDLAKRYERLAEQADETAKHMAKIRSAD